LLCFVSGFTASFSFSLFSLSQSGAAPRGGPACLLCWPQAFNELYRLRRPTPLSSTPLVFSGCKSTTFLITGKHFFQLFFIKHTINLNIN